nr:hypothetical protein [Clostridia bacterium]
MADLQMVQPVTLETVQQYAINSGMMCIDVDITSCKSAEELINLVNKEQGKWLGATSGTTDISENRKSWSPDHNGLRMAWKGANWLESAQPSIKAKLVQMKPGNIKVSSGAADIEGEDTDAIKIKPRTSYKDDDYHSVLWFTNYGTNALICAYFKNALCVSGLKWTIDDKKVATCDVEFRAHADSPISTDYLPVEYYIFKSTAPDEPSEQSAPDEPSEQ